jgi:outer membrane protein assembly factor BamB
LLFAWSTSPLLADKNWPEFRGPRGNGFSDSQGLPTTWSSTEHVRWKTDLRGKAWSSPVVWDDQIWVTTAPKDGKELFALCLDLYTGKIEKDIKVFSIENPQFCIEKNSYASPTPAIEAGRVYVHFGAHGTACIDTKTGEILWTRQDLECNHHRGPASSPVLWRDLLILTFDGFDVQYLVAVDKKTGKNVWKTDRNLSYKSDNGDIKKAYSTPTVIEVAGKPLLVSPSAEASVAYNPADGKEVWRVRSGGMNASSRPIFGNGLVYMSAPDGGFQMFAVKPDGNGDVTGSNVVWKQAKGIPKHASHILVGELLFMASEQGIISCLNAMTGESLWQERVGGVYTASPLHADGRIYFFSEDGKTPVIAASKEFKLLATNELPDGFMASPAVTGKSLILRTKTAIYRIEE